MQIICMHRMGRVWPVCVHMCVSDKSLKSDLEVDICLRLGVLKLLQITACYYQCWANRRQFAFGWWAILKVSPWCRRRKGCFFFSFQYRMKREGNEIWRFKEAGSERGRIILDGWRRGGEWRRVEDEDALKWDGSTLQKWWRKMYTVHFRERERVLVKWRGCTVGAAPQHWFLCSGRL